MNKPSLYCLVSAVVFATGCFSDVDPTSGGSLGTEETAGDGDGDGDAGDGDGAPGDGDGEPGDGDGEPGDGDGDGEQGDGDGEPGDGDGEPGCEAGSCPTGEYCVAGVCEAPPEGMVAVPAGPFWMGCNQVNDGNCQNDEYPYHEVTLSAYAIDRTEVTAAAYAECVQQGACAEIGGNNTGMQPAMGVTWFRAEAYCEWAGKQLPTEAQREKAARGDDGRLYPWGNQAPNCTLVGMMGCGVEGVPTVGSYPAGASPYGALDMTGSLHEWVADWHSPSYYVESPAVDPVGPANGTNRVVRSGAFYTDEAKYFRSSLRLSVEPTVAFTTGFRCAYVP